MHQFNFLMLFLLSKTGILILSLSISIPVVIALAVVLGIFCHRKSYDNSLKNYVDKHNSFKNQLDTTCSSMITRLQTLSKSSEHFLQLYDMRVQQKELIVKEFDEKVLKTTSQLRTYLKDKKYKSAKVQDKQTKEALNEYVLKVKKLEEDLSTDLKEDEDTRNASLDIKKRYRNIKDFYKEHVDELKKITTFDTFFDETDTLFNKFDENLDKAEYKKALNILPKAETKIKKVEEVLNELPTIETLIDVIIPIKVDNISKEYKVLCENKFILTYIKVDETLSSIVNGLKIQQEKVFLFDLNGVLDSLNEYQNEIANIQVSFENERNAKEFYETNKIKLIKDSYEVEKEYQKVLQMIVKHAKTFILNQNRIDELNNKKADLDVIYKYHRKLESYDTEEIVEPYTVVVKGMNFLRDEVDSLNQMIKDYYDYVANLNELAQNMFYNLAKYYKRLKDAEVVVRHVINLDVYTEKTLVNFEQLYKTITLIDSLLKTKPIDIVKIENIYDSFKTNCEGIINEVENKKVASMEAEDLITHANYYRVSYSESREYLDQAEKHFNEGEFEIAKNEAMRVLKTYANITEDENR